MSSPIPIAKRFLTTAKRRVRGARPGSILILVVALLVLVAIIGTAALSTNTIDRYATGQNNANTQVDLLVEGVKNMAKAVIVGDLQGRTFAGAIAYRPEGSPTYDHWDMPLMVDLTNRPTGMRQDVFDQLKLANDAWLSPRFPDLLLPHPMSGVGVPVTFNALFDPSSYAANPPVWDCIGSSLESPNGAATSGQFLFDTPGVFDATGALVATAARGYNNRITDRRNVQDLDASNNVIPNPMVPVAVPINVAHQLGGTPAWQFNGNFYIAADADGDGITDSGLKRINVGEINGLTYYYAVRIIDNGSAINVNTAHSRDHEFLGDNGDGQGAQAMTTRGATPWPQATNFFPSNIGLVELLRTSNSATATSLTALRGAGTLNEIGRIDQYRFNGVMLPTGVVNIQANGTSTPNNAVIVDDPNGGTNAISSRTDFAYNTVGELLHFGLGRRIGNPGYLTTTTQFKPFSVSESAALAYHFVMANPEASKSALESATSLATNPANNPVPTAAQIDSLYWSAPNRLPPLGGPPRNTIVDRASYKNNATGLGYWYFENFDWDGEFSGTPTTENPAQYRNRRAMFTADNPVSNQLPLPAGVTTASAFTKASVNTASFNQLYGAFFSVMAEGGAESPYRVPGTKTPNPNATPQPEQGYLYAGMKNSQSQPTDMALDPTNTQPPASFERPNGGDTNIDRMFRNVIRDNDPAVVGNTNVKYQDDTNTMSGVTDSSMAVHMRPKHIRRMRAWLAAANTVSMRSPFRRFSPFVYRASAPANSTDPLLARISNTDAPVDVIAYGAEPQPFITEVYVNTDTNRTGEDYETDPAAPALGRNEEPYVAIELFYPYPITHGTTPPDPPLATGAAWDMRPYGQFDGWQIQMINRTTVRPGGHLPTVVNIGSITAGNTDAYFEEPLTADRRYGSYIILENFNENSATPASEKVKYRPRSSGLPYTTPLKAWHNGVTTLPPIKSVYVRDLAKLIKAGQLPTDLGGELVISRPVVDRNAAGPAFIPPRPIDSFDFTGLENQSANFIAYTLHYCRRGKVTTLPTSDPNSGEWWSFIYPGRYDGGLVPAGSVARRHQGTQLGRWRNKPPAVPDDPADPDWPLAPGNYDPFDRVLRAPFEPLDPKVTLGGEYQGLPAVSVPADSASATATYPNPFKTQLLNHDQPGWNAVGNGAAVPNRFPFGAFARNADIMQIPYFAAYRIKPATPDGTALSTDDIEINSMSMDSAFCEDTDVFDDETSTTAFGFNTYEQLGRFCPVTASLNGLPDPAVNKIEIDDLDPAPDKPYRYFVPDPPLADLNTGLTKKAWRYRWATRVFDFLTVQDPQSDYLPNVEPFGYAALSAGNTPVPVSNEGGRAADPNSGTAAFASTENTVPLHGLININTASWRVLSAINWTPFPTSDTANRDRFQLVTRQDGELEMSADSGGNGVDDNIELAKAITWWRDGKDNITDIPVFVPPPPDGPVGGPIGPKGPFRSLYDLYRVWALRTYYNKLADPAVGLGEPDDIDGDYSPNNFNPLVTGGSMPPLDETRADFEERFQLLSRVSNLITTRSDSFTVYIVVQGWRNVNDPARPPELVVQRRAAFIADRSGVTATGGSLKVTNVATE